MSSLGRDDHGQPIRPFAFNLINNQRKGIDQLIGLAHGILADGIVNEEESKAFRQWLEITAGSTNEWPFCDIRDRVAAIYADGKVSEEERQELKDIMHQITGTGAENDSFERSTGLPLDDPPPVIAFTQREFCLTGRFAFGVRREVAALIERQGGGVCDNPRESTSYLIIGAFSSRDWVHTNYGRKIERAVELKGK